MKAEIAKSRGEGRRLIEQGGITVDGEKVTDVFATVSYDDVKRGVVIKKGKKIFKKLVLA